MKRTILKFGLVLCLLAFLPITQTDADAKQISGLIFKGYVRKTVDGRQIGIVKAIDPETAVTRTVVEFLTQINAEWTIEKRAQEVARRLNQIYKDHPNFCKSLDIRVINGQTVLTWKKSATGLMTIDQKSASICNMVPDEYAKLLIKNLQIVLYPSER